MGLLNDRVALVTGAGGGIGSAIARALAAEGAAVVLVGRNQHSLDALAGELSGGGRLALAVQADVTDEAAVESAVAATLARFARLDLLVNNAGIFDGAPLVELSADAWDQVMAVNLRGPFLCTRAAMKAMQLQASGRIINIGSLSAKRVRANSAAYSASKHGLIGLTQVTALEGRPYGISCGILQPGNVVVDKKGHVTEPMMEPATVAKMVVAMATVPDDVYILEAIMLPVGQAYIGRG